MEFGHNREGICPEIFISAGLFLCQDTAHTTCIDLMSTALTIDVSVDNRIIRLFNDILDI